MNKMPERIWAKRENDGKLWAVMVVWPTKTFTEYVRADLVVNQGLTRICELQEERINAQIQIDIGNQALETTMRQRDKALEQLDTLRAEIA